jgi:hypothetical protein
LPIGSWELSTKQAQTRTAVFEHTSDHPPQTTKAKTKAESRKQKQKPQPKEPHLTVMLLAAVLFVVATYLAFRLLVVF